MTEDCIIKINIGKPFRFIDKKLNKVWLSHPSLIELRKEPIIKLDWEHTEYKWIKAEKLKEFDIVLGLDKSLAEALK